MCTIGAWLGSVCLFTGTMVGAGLLAVPVALGLAGFLPGIIAALVAAAIMWASGCVLAERMLEMRLPNGDIAALFQADLGAWTRWFTLPAYLLILFGVLTAYLAGAATILAGLIPLGLPLKLWIIPVFIAVLFFMLFGQSWMLRWNKVLVAMMLLAFAALVAVATQHMEPANLSYANLSAVPFAFPSLCFAFTFHNVVPVICKQLNWNRRAVHCAMAAGVILAFIMLAAWFTVVAGSVPAHAATGPTLEHAFEQGMPATVPMGQLPHMRVTSACGLVFSLLAILTSFIGFGSSLTSFLCDIFPPLRPEGKRPLVFALAFIPPFALSLADPRIFLEIIDAVGGLGVIVLLGLLPALCFLKRYARRRPLASAMTTVLMVALMGIAAIELGKASGVIRPDPGRGLVFAR